MIEQYKKILHKLHKLIFDIQTPSGRMVDRILILMVTLSVITVMLESEEQIRSKIGSQLVILEWFFTIIFTLEYILRIKTAPNKLKYIFSFFGIIDLIAIIPTYLSMFITGIASPLIIRSVRLLRIFRVFKFVQFLYESELLLKALQRSWHKIVVFLMTALTFATISGTIMFLVEGKENGFNSIPHSVYWAIVTLTTVGYGDISPNTPLGQALASAIMIIGYGIIAVPTGLVAAEMVYSKNKETRRRCPSCGHTTYEKQAVFCSLCGNKIIPDTTKKA